MASCNTNNGDDKFTEAHAGSSDEQQPSTADAIDELNTENSHDSVDDVQDDRDNEGILDASLLEEGSSIVENEVDASQLLPADRKSVV